MSIDVRVCRLCSMGQLQSRPRACAAACAAEVMQNACKRSQKEQKLALHCSCRQRGARTGYCTVCSLRIVPWLVLD